MAANLRRYLQERKLAGLTAPADLAVDSALHAWARAVDSSGSVPYPRRLDVVSQA